MPVKLTKVIFEAEGDPSAVYHDFTTQTTGPGSLPESGAWMVHMAAEVAQKFLGMEYKEKMALLKQLSI